MKLQDLIEMDEVQRLKGCYERNDWHDEDVYTHTMTVLRAIIDLNQPKWVQIATVLHDIAKPYTHTKVGDNSLFPNHELLSACMGEELLEDEVEHKKEIIDLIKNHGTIHKQILSLDSNCFYISQKMPLLYFGYAETITSRLLHTRADEYVARITKYKQLLF